MKVLSIILGIILIIFGISLTATPLMTFMATGYYFAILMLVYGVLGVIAGIVAKKYGAGFVFAIISIIGGIAMLTLPGMILFTDAMAVYCMACWFIIEGCLGVCKAFAAKNLGSKSWGWILVLAILGIIIGIYSFCHPVITAISLGILIGIYFIYAGFKMVIAD